jgi:quinol monooxygenase YgiN
MIGIQTTSELKTLSNTITIIAVLQAKPGQEERVRAQALSMVAPSLAEPGCLSYRAYVDPEDPGSWVVIEEWADRAAFEAHLASAHLVQAQEAAGTLLAGPPSVKVLIAAD